MIRSAGLHPERVRIHPVRRGWHPLACWFAALETFGNALYSMDPVSNSAKAIAHIGGIGPYLIAAQMLAATIVLGQAQSDVMRRARFGFVVWIVLAACALLRFAAALIATDDAWFQAPLYFGAIALYSWGAINASRTD